jgi:hypothetical protein
MRDSAGLLAMRLWKSPLRLHSSSYSSQGLALMLLRARMGQTVL